MRALYEFKLLSKCSNIKSFRLKPFCCCNHISSCKNNFCISVSNVNVRTKILFTSFTHTSKHLFWLALLRWSNYMEKIIPEKQDFSFLKARSQFWKISRLAETGWFLHVIRNVFLNEKEYLNGFSPKYRVPAKRDEFLIQSVSRIGK